MREIKFRAWDSCGKKYWDGVDFITWSKPSNWHDFFVLEQFTGILDKNGNEIYENDIVRHIVDVELWKYSGHVIFQSDGAIGWSVQTKDGRWGMNSKNVYEIIGNIHQA